MADALSTMSQVDVAVGVYRDRKLLETLMPELYLYQYAEKKNLPSKEGKQIFFTRLTSFGNFVNVTEATTPDSKALSANAVSANIVQKALVVKTSDLLEETSILDVESDVVRQMAADGAGTVDWVLWTSFFGAIGTEFLEISAFNQSALLANTSGMTSGASKPNTFNWNTSGFPREVVSAANAAYDALSGLTGTYDVFVTDIRKIVSHLRRRNSKPFTDGYYIGVANSDWLASLRTDPLWQETWKYTNNRPLLRGEVGELEGVRFVMSNKAPQIGLGNGTVSANFAAIFGRGAYAATEIGSLTGPRGVKTTIVPRTKVDHTNPLGLYSTLGCTITIAATVLNASCGVLLATTIMP